MSDHKPLFLLSSLKPNSGLSKVVLSGLFGALYLLASSTAKAEEKQTQDASAIEHSINDTSSQIDASSQDKIDLQSSQQDGISQDSNEGSDSWYSEFKVVPFGFLSDSIGNSLGAAGLIKGAGQPQAALLGAGFYSDKGSYMTFLGGYNYQLGNRWLMDVSLYNARFKDYDYYLGEASNNDSQYDDSVVSDGTEELYKATLRYVLPLGLGKDKPSVGYSTTRDIQGSTPWTSGVSYLEIEPFYRARRLDDVDYDEPESTWGISMTLDWDNRDDIRNTTTGSRTQFNFTYAPEMGNDNSWQTWEFQNSHYWDLGSLWNVFNKQVFAFDFYTAGTPNWDNGTTGNEHSPPEYAGIKLGGLYRQRAFSGGRYTGRAAINYSFEYRVMPDWQPLQNWPIFDLYNVPWWQWVVFTDIGRVADEYDLSTLNKDMQVSIGGAIRFQVEGVVVRTEMAWGDEESIFRVMVNQPF